MKRAFTTASILLALPAAAVAQVAYYDPPLTASELRTCMERDHAVRNRTAMLDDEKLDNDRESQALARTGDSLALELRSLDSANPAAVADYNARSADHNRRVELHNRRVADYNARAALTAGDAEDLNARCAARGYLLRDRDYILYDRSTIR